MDGKPMTLEELKAWGKPWVSPTQASGLLGCQPYSLNLSARNGTLGLPYVFVGRNLKISAKALLKFCEGG